VGAVLAAFEQVVPHADVPAGLAAARDAGLAVAALTNGTATITEGFLSRAGLAHLVDDVLEAQASGVWKPHACAYQWAAAQLDRDPAALGLVAVHPWDVHGARSAGLVGAFLDRDGSRWPDHFLVPDVTAPTLSAVVDALVAP
jgi:2-haloacid dehalogenase